MNEDEQFDAFMKALTQIQKQNDLMIRVMIRSYITLKSKENV